jgi:hypothetical protein
MIPVLFIISYAVAVVILTSLLIILIYTLRPQKKLEELLSRFFRTAKMFNLSIAKKEVVGNSVIGIDDLNDKVLFVKDSKHKHDRVLVDLKDIKNSTIKQIFEPKMDRNAKVRIIALQLNFKSQVKPAVLPFYDDKIDNTSEVSDRADQVIQWQTLLSAKLAKRSNPTENRRNLTKDTYIPMAK